MAVFESFSFGMHSHCAFSHILFSNVETTIIFVATLLGLLILNLSLVAKCHKNGRGEKLVYLTSTHNPQPVGISLTPIIDVIFSSIKRISHET